ncbi:MAG TPA: tricarballylate utilization 4Fe-4S protein TcuB [Gaiellaceae bacterium]|nr:tricarballylate utilization 4Fe-4S protein TcuB [Gaiellaceae bacterium]
MLSEANRQFSVCNSCRYCEGICAVFPAMELRSSFASGDVSYLSSLCHDCRACVHACPYSPPHEFAVDIPSLMAQARSETFETYARPQAFWRLLTRTSSILAAVLVTLILATTVAVTTHDAGAVVRTHTGSGSFYEVIPFLWLLLPAVAISICCAIAILAGAHGLAREATGGARQLVRLKPIAAAAADALRLKHLGGGGGGCYYPAERVSRSRRRLHHCVFYGFGAMFLSTVAAAFQQDVLGIEPPYPVLSVPVVLGTLGGIATLAGCVGFLVIGIRSRGAGKIDDARRLDRSFTVTLLFATLTGLLTLVLRSTSLMGAILIVHLAALGGLYLTFPYSKFVHWVYRYVALVRSHVEAEAPSARPHSLDVPIFAADQQTPGPAAELEA